MDIGRSRLIELPIRIRAPELHVACAEGERHADRDACRERCLPRGTEVVRIDGLRVEYRDGFGVARATNTMPLIVLRFEAEVATAFARIQDELRRLPRAAKPSVALPC